MMIITLVVVTALVIVAISLSLVAIKRIRQILHHENLSKSHIGELNNASPNKERSVIIIGGSLGGLISAATLSHHFKQVTILEQQDYVADRSNAPQRHFIHSLLFRGRSILEKLFPGFSKGMINKGALLVDYSEFEGVTPVGSLPQFERGEMDLTLLSFSRNLLEVFIREQVKAIRNVEIRTGVAVDDLIMDSNMRNKVVGVKLASGEVLNAHLVVDCSGRSTKTLSRLIDLFQPGQKVVDFQTVVRSNVVYSSAHFKIKEGHALRVRNGIKQQYVLFRGAYPSCKTVGVNAIEDGKAILSLIGVNNPQMPKTVYEARTSYGGPQDHKLLQEVTNQILDAFECQDEDELKIYKKEGSTYQHFERFRMIGYVALGDVVCSLSPIYGQGMTLISEQCLILDSMLRQSKMPIDMNESFGQEFQKRVYDAVSMPWTMIAVGDLKYPGTKGGNPLLKKTLYPILGRLMTLWAKRAITDKYMWKSQIKFQHMDQGYKTQFFKPGFIKRLIFG